MKPILEAVGVSKYYGAFKALENVSLKFFEDEIVAVVGPNGAGKTTFVNVLTGLLKPTHGEVNFLGKSIAGVGPVLLAQYGMARAFQLVQIFPQLTVQETIMAAVISQRNIQYDFWSDAQSKKDLIERALARTDQNKGAAARLLGLKRTTLVEKLKRTRIGFLDLKGLGPGEYRHLQPREVERFKAQLKME